MENVEFSRKILHFQQKYSPVLRLKEISVIFKKFESVQTFCQLEILSFQISGFLIFLSKILFPGFFERRFEFFRGFSSVHFRTFQPISKLRLFLDRKHNPRLILDYPRNRYDGIDPKNDRYFQVIGQILTWILHNLFLALV